MKYLAIVLICLAWPVWPAWADGDSHDRARRALEAGEILSLDKILKAAEAARRGRVIEIELDRDDGRWIYELELVSPEGHLYEMEIDAATGAILKTEREDD